MGRLNTVCLPAPWARLGLRVQGHRVRPSDTPVIFLTGTVLPNVELRVLPFDLGLHVGTGPFTLLTFPDQLLPDAAYQEYAVGGHIIDDQSMVARLARLFDELRGQSLDADESLAMIAQLANLRHE